MALHFLFVPALAFILGNPNQDTHQRRCSSQSNREPQGVSHPANRISAVLVRINLDGTSKPQTRAQAVQLNRADERSSHALQIALDAVAGDDLRGCKDEIGAESQDEQCWEFLRPVILMDGHCRQQNARNKSRHRPYRHHKLRRHVSHANGAYSTGERCHDRKSRKGRSVEQIGKVADVYVPSCYVVEEDARAHKCEEGREQHGLKRWRGPN